MQQDATSVSIFHYSLEKNDQFLSTVYPAELKSRSTTKT